MGIWDNPVLSDYPGPARIPDGERISRERSEIAAKRQRGAALQAEALRLFDEADEQARLLELARIELPRRADT